MILVWAFWHIVIRSHDIDTRRDWRHPGQVWNFCSCGQWRHYYEPVLSVRNHDPEGRQR